MMRALVTGAGGLLSAAVAREFAACAELHALGRQSLDVTDAGAVRATIVRVRPDVVINCAAYNDVDGAEEDPVTAIRVNGLAVRALAEAARECGAALVHYSSDFVFDGETDRPYAEEDPPNPRGVYAASKLLGDWFALEHPRGYVLRVESLFGDPGPETVRTGSLSTIVARIRSGEEVPVFIDRTVSPTHTADIARATHALLKTGAAPGLYHCANSGHATWAEIAAYVARLLERPLRMKPITVETAALRATRPRYCALSSQKLANAGVAMASWQDAIQRYLALAGT